MLSAGTARREDERGRTMAYEFKSEKDNELKKFKQKTFGLSRLRLTAHSYDGKQPKIQITRQRRNSEDDDAEWKFSKLGRLDYHEIKWLGSVIRKQIIPWFEDHLAPGDRV